MNNKPKLVFAPGCFDNFEGTQEELDELVAEITRMVESGEILEQSLNLNDDELADEFREHIENMFDENTNTRNRLLN
jgi:hypothetical protein